MGSLWAEVRGGFRDGVSGVARVTAVTGEGQQHVEGRLRGWGGRAAMPVPTDTWEATTLRERHTF